MKLVIEDDQGRRTVVPVFRDELLIGRAEESAVRLTEKDVSRRHARLLRRGGRLYLEDLDSFTGVRVNGDRVHGSRLVREGDLIEISQYDLLLQSGPDEKAAPDPVAEAITPPIRRASRGLGGRRTRIATFVVALLLASALAAALWRRTIRTNQDEDTRPLRDPAPPGSRDSVR
jgi:pSer/pThr/pTyr-binding forkhead associated (FHA) protein